MNLLDNDIGLNFKIDEVFHGLAETKGIAWLIGKDIILEFQTKDTVVGLIKSGIKRLKIPLRSVIEVTIKKSFFSAEVIFRTNSLSALKDIPFADGAKIALKVPRKEKNTAVQFVSRINFALAEIKLEDAENGFF